MIVGVDRLRDGRPSGGQRAPRATRQSRSPRNKGAVEAVLRLQRTAGNRALAQLLAPPGRSERPVTVQRDIGFEFESAEQQLWEATSGEYVNPETANAVGLSFTAGQIKPLKKKTPVLRAPFFELQADDHPRFKGKSDPEIVTSPFPETKSGRRDLKKALARMRKMNAPLTKPRNEGIPIKVLARSAGMTVLKPHGLITGYPTDIGMFSAPQVTFAVGLASVGRIVKDLHGKQGESAESDRARAGGRLMMRPHLDGEKDRPKPVSGDAAMLVTARSYASVALAEYARAHPDAPGGQALKGLLTLVYAYSLSGPRKAAFLKQASPVLAKTDLATTWKTLPKTVRDHYGRKELRDLVAAHPSYGVARLRLPLFHGVGALEQETDGGRLPEWYKAITLGGWLSEIVDGVDRLSTVNFPTGIPEGKEVEGFAAFGDLTGRVGGLPAPILELRSATRFMDLVRFEPWALEMFDYIAALNAGGHRVPGLP